MQKNFDLKEREPNPNKIKVYHYTSESALDDIQNGSRGDLYKDPRSGRWVGSEDARGVWPMERAVPDNMSAGLGSEATTPCIFALLEPKDSGWFQNKKLWKRLMEHTKGEILLELTLTEDQLGKTFVADGGIFTDTQRGETSERDMYRRYWESRVPIQEYLAGGIRYQIPEVIILDRIDLENVEAIL